VNLGSENRSFSLVVARIAVAAVAAFSIVFSCGLGVAEAHGGGPGLTYDPCVQGAGSDDFVHLAVYQPRFNPFAEYCEAVPKAGSTLLVFDLMGSELPNLPVSLDVVDMGARSQLSVPPRRYRSGVVDVRADLPPGRYTVLVNVDEPEGRRGVAFPLTVGARWNGLGLPIAIILVIAVVTAAYCAFQFRFIAPERGNLSVKDRIELRRVRKF
jgi:hypothetical protein